MQPHAGSSHPHTVDGFDYRLVILCAENQWEQGERLLLCQGQQRRPRLITIWLELSEEAVTPGSVDTCRWYGGRQMMRASSFYKCVISSVLVPLLFCWICFFSFLPFFCQAAFRHKSKQIPPLSFPKEALAGSTWEGDIKEMTWRLIVPV